MIILDNQKSSWIYVAKTCSIIGVVLQHVRGYIYTDDNIFYSLWWVVALFIMIGGYNVMDSFAKRGKVIVKKRIWGILIPYFVATVLYTLYDNRYLNAAEVFIRLLHFDATGPLYYVAVYVQLVLITPILIGIIKWCETNNNVLRFIVVWVGIMATCYATTHLTNLFDIVIGGGNLFAGPWLFFWFWGMFIERCNIRVDSSYRRVVVFVTHTVMIIAWQYVFVHKGLNSVFHPIFHGNAVRMTWANSFETVILFFWFKELVEGIESIAGNVGKKILKPFTYIGQHTLYIFLYHMLFLSIYRMYFEESRNILMDGLCLVFIILGPLILDWGLEKVKNWFKYIMKDIKVV